MSTEEKPSAKPLTEMIAIGEKLHESRKEHAFSVYELAKRSGVSAGMISQIERGIANPSINIISKLAAALNLQLGIFFDPKPDVIKEKCVVRKAARRKIGIPDPDFLYELLTPSLDYDLEFVWVESAPGASTECSPFSHAGQECGLVIQGTLEVWIKDDCYILNAGDSIIISDCRIPHWYRNQGSERVLSVWAITPPTF